MNTKERKKANAMTLLEQLYNNRAAVPDHAAIFARWAAQSAATRRTYKSHCHLAYGAHAKQTLDLFPALQSKGLAIFIHGGYWRSLDKDDFSFIAEPFLAKGISFASINYRLCPDATISDIVEDCESAITWLAKHSHEYSVDFSRNVLLGHSAGAHLVAMMYCTDWATRGVDAASFLGGVGVSGIYDLGPLLHVSMNADLKLDAPTAEQLSPINHAPRLDVPFDLMVGAAETSEFIRQTSLLPSAWPKQARWLETVTKQNHFTIVDYFANAECVTLQRTLAMLD
jgi:arylformamidase